MMTHSGHISETRCFRCVVVKLHPLFLRMVHADCKHATVTTYSADYADVPKHAGNNNCDTSKQCIFQCNEQQSIGWRNCEMALHSSHTKVNWLVKLWNGTPIISHQMGLEPTTFCSEDRCSAIEPLVLKCCSWGCPTKPQRLPSPPNGIRSMTSLLGGNLSKSAGVEDPGAAPWGLFGPCRRQQPPSLFSLDVHHKTDGHLIKGIQFQ